jgi:hypothetical protein
MRSGKGADAQFLVVAEPVIAWDPGVVLIDLAEAVLPVVELAGTDAEPREEATSRDIGLVAPGADEINEPVPAIVGNPTSF